ncbi:MAG: hypothetical protein ACE5HD_08950 [Acidobacteriota bacterium]
MAQIAAVGTAFPEHSYRQPDVLQALKRVWRNIDLDHERLARLSRRTGVRRRHFALPLEAYHAGSSWGDCNTLWSDLAEKLGARAILDALGRAGLQVGDVGTLIFVSVTGLSTPSINARLVNRLALPVTVRRLPLFGLGCVAGDAGLARCADLVEPGRQERWCCLRWNSAR